MSLGVTADGKPIVDGLIVFTNDMKAGKVLGDSERPHNPGWFDVEHPDGSTSMMNAERVSTTFRTYEGATEYAAEAYTKAQKQITRDVPSTAVTAIATVLLDLGSEIIDQESTPGAIGYTRITYKAQKGAAS